MQSRRQGCQPNAIEETASTEQRFGEHFRALVQANTRAPMAQAGTRGPAGAFECEAIRPHIGGRFEDLLRAAAMHPGMLRCLDNEQSAGTHSRIVQQRARAAQCKDDQQGRQVALTLARKASDMLAAAAGPRIAVIEMGGWDTHANPMSANGALANNLRTLDAALATLRDSLGAAWRRNVVGGWTITDWPGLSKSQRHEGRDLRVTTDLRAVIKGVLSDHLQLPSAAIESTVLPGSAAVRKLSLSA